MVGHPHRKLLNWWTVSCAVLDSGKSLCHIIPFGTVKTIVSKEVGKLYMIMRDTRLIMRICRVEYIGISLVSRYMLDRTTQLDPAEKLACRMRKSDRRTRTRTHRYWIDNIIEILQPWFLYKIVFNIRQYDKAGVRFAPSYYAYWCVRPYHGCRRPKPSFLYADKRKTAWISLYPAACVNE